MYPRGGFVRGAWLAREDQSIVRSAVVFDQIRRVWCGRKTDEHTGISDTTIP